MNTSPNPDSPASVDTLISFAGEPGAAMLMRPSPAHQLMTLVGCTFLLFECVFLFFYSDNFWFSFDLVWAGIPVVLIMAVLAHFVLTFLESDRACDLASFILLGKPLIVYRQWLRVDSQGIEFGRRRLQWTVIDELYLTYWGVLEVRSHALCGASAVKSDVVLKIPFALAAQAEQARLLLAFRAACPELKVNKRVQDRLSSPLIKGQNAIQLSGAVLMACVLLDLGLSSFVYLETLKHYYFAQDAVAHGSLADAGKQLAQADYLQNHALTFSYLGGRLFNQGVSAALLLSVRADLLSDLGRRQEAVESLNKAIAARPDNFRLYLQLARLLDKDGRSAASREQISRAIEHHEDSLLPRLYMLAAVHGQPAQSKSVYSQAMNDFSASTFKDDPVWPPGSHTYLHDLFYQQDIAFVLTRLLGIADKPDGHEHSP